MIKLIVQELFCADVQQLLTALNVTTPVAIISRHKLRRLGPLELFVSQI